MLKNKYYFSQVHLLVHIFFECDLGWVPHSTENFLQIWNILLHFSVSVPSVLWRLYFFGGNNDFARILFREYRRKLWMEENSKPIIRAGLVRAGLLTTPTISMRFEIFFCIFPFQYLSWCEGFTMLAAKKDFASVFVQRMWKRGMIGKILKLAYDLGWACVCWVTCSTNNFNEYWKFPFFCILPFQYLQCYEGLTFFGSKKMILLLFLYREHRRELWMEENSTPTIWTGLLIISMRFEIFLHFSFSVPSVL